MFMHPKSSDSGGGGGGGGCGIMTVTTITATITATINPTVIPAESMFAVTAIHDEQHLAVLMLLQSSHVFCTITSVFGLVTAEIDKHCVL